MHERARLEQLGEVRYDDGGISVGNIWWESIDCDKDEDETIAEIWKSLGAGGATLHITDHTSVAFWWDPRIQDWGTSPNAPEGWPAPANDPEDIRARLAVRLEGVEVEYWHGQDYPSDDVHWTATAHKWVGYGDTREAAYLDIWQAMTKKY